MVIIVSSCSNNVAKSMTDAAYLGLPQDSRGVVSGTILEKKAKGQFKGESENEVVVFTMQGYANTPIQFTITPSKKLGIKIQVNNFAPPSLGKVLLEEENFSSDLSEFAVILDNDQVITLEIRGDGTKGTIGVEVNHPDTSELYGF